MSLTQGVALGWDSVAPLALRPLATKNKCVARVGHP
jgi:hypothetical protein